ncbi:MAG: Com family DNA-binding transcriptional regulator [Peptostreptococcaceae bacterium]|nr:Com family DNA-binding transcriptional regulator [Peptostreptococcaceae bacterium]
MQVRCKNCNRILLVNKDAKGRVQIQCPRCKEKKTYKL